MDRHHSLLARIFLSIALILTQLTAVADQIGFNAPYFGNAVDGGSSYGWTLDGNFDAMLNTYDFVLNAHKLVVSKIQGSTIDQLEEKRAVFEATLPAQLTQPGVTITSATLAIDKAQYGATTLTSNTTFKVYGYNADGQVTLSDFANTGTLAWSVNNTTPPFYVDVTGVIQNLLAIGGTRVGFVLAVDGIGSVYELSNNVAIDVVYTVAGTPPPEPNLPPTVTILSPMNNSQLTYGSPVTFSGTALDPETGAIPSITWFSSIYGLIGTGLQVTTSALPVGTHTITAKATDALGAYGLASITVTVAVPAPVGYCTARGNTSTYEWINSFTLGSTSRATNNNGGYADYTATAQIPVSLGNNTMTVVPGFQSGSYPEYWRVWIDLNRNQVFDSNELVYSGNGNTSLTGNLAVPTTTTTGTTRMRVLMSYGSAAPACGNFSYGEVEDYTVNITNAPPPPPPPTTSYCASRGNSSSYEWISSITVGGTLKSTGNNGGYRDMTASGPVPLLRGSNPINLTPGFGYGAYIENWRIWIDYNQDKNFTTDELVYSGSGNGVLTNAIQVPATALSGSTRMRVSMKYGTLPSSCETFTYGEVEDYTVTIP